MVEWKNPLSGKESNLWEKTRIQSKTGANLAVWYRSKESDSEKGTILLAHPMGKPAKGEFLKTGYADALLQNGYNVVIFDFNGFGESEMGNWDYHHDILAARNFMLNTFPDSKYFLHGISFGCNWASHALKQPDNPFKKVILESAPVNLLEFWVHYPIPYRILKFMYIFLPQYREYTDFEYQLKSTKNCDEILLISSDSDVYTPLSMARRMKEAANTKANILNIENSRHALAILKNKDLYLERVFEFLGN